MYGHDSDCGGCFTAKRFEAARGRPIPVTAALGHCDKCGRSMNSVYVHKVQGKRLCSDCAEIEVRTNQKAEALEYFREASDGKP